MRRYTCDFNLECCKSARTKFYCANGLWCYCAVANLRGVHWLPRCVILYENHVTASGYFLKLAFPVFLLLHRKPVTHEWKRVMTITEQIKVWLRETRRQGFGIALKMKLSDFRTFSQTHLTKSHDLTLRWALASSSRLATFLSPSRNGSAIQSFGAMWCTCFVTCPGTQWTVVTYFCSRAWAWPNGKKLAARLELVLLNGKKLMKCFQSASLGNEFSTHWNGLFFRWDNSVICLK